MPETNVLQGKKVLVIGYENNKAKSETEFILKQLEMQANFVPNYADGTREACGTLMESTPQHTPEHYDVVLLHHPGGVSDAQNPPEDFVSALNNAGIPVLVHTSTGIEGFPAGFHHRLKLAEHAEGITGSDESAMFAVLQGSEFTNISVAKIMYDLFDASQKHQTANPPAQIDTTNNGATELGVVVDACAERGVH